MKTEKQKKRLLIKRVLKAQKSAYGATDKQGARKVLESGKGAAMEYLELLRGIS